MKGVAYVLFGIEINGEKKRITSMKKLNDVSGRMGEVCVIKKRDEFSIKDLPVYLQLNGKIVSLTMEEIKKAYPDISRLLGSSVYVKASVMTSSGGKIIEKQLKTTHNPISTA